MNIKHSSWTESAMKPSIHFFNFAKWNFLSNYLEDIEVDLVFKKSKLQTSKQWLFCGYFEKQPFGGVLRKRCSENMQQIYRTPIPKCDFNKVAKQLYWNRTSIWVFFRKFAAYFQNTSKNTSGLVRFVRVKIHQYTSFNGTSMKLSTIVALLKIFEISLRPQFLDSGCTFYRPESSP